MSPKHLVLAGLFALAACTTAADVSKPLAEGKGNDAKIKVADTATHGIKRPPINNARDRYLTAAEAQRLHAAVSESRNTQLKYIVGLLLLTGARVSELLNAEWRHVDVDRRSWLIPTSKTGKPRHVPLSQAAIDLIKQVPRFPDCPYLLPNPDTLKPFTEIKHAWQHARYKANLPDLRVHDLRHSSASFMINSGINLFVVGKILGHADHKLTMRYSHIANDTLMAAVEAGSTKQGVNWS
ncbi:site-specific integrase [Sphingomonas sp. CFBP 13720]|uniref:site-specific integrase n=1 Tax=Sphingomonas sp. CFBP 13720 TaxID=2775302 RepID=UPI00177A93E7|nr:site-specific integrase [Sphingomonas sp. CFBP 13720]MBD8679642.1 site-specific integrase [Sphingomonas sp. CFBP 13720]